MAQILSTNTFTTAKWIVDSTLSNGTHTTIASAITSASSGDTIFIRPGTYTGNFTLKAGVNLTAFPSDASLNGTGKVIISGNATLSTAGTVTISGIQLQTNFAAFLTVSGSAASVVNLVGCYLNCTNATGIVFSAANTSAQVRIQNCNGNLGTTGIAYFNMTSTGTMFISFGDFFNSGASTTANTISAGGLYITQININNPITSSGTTALIAIQEVTINTSVQNVTSITHNSTSATASNLNSCTISSGTASAISIGASATLHMFQNNVISSNTNSITGSGTLLNSGNILNGSNKTNVTTQTGGSAMGLTQGTAPSAGYIGEEIRSSNPAGTGLANATNANLLSISLTAGIWDVACVAQFAAGGVAGTKFQASISTTSLTLGTLGDNNISDDFTANNFAVVIPSYRLTLSSTTTVYLVVVSNFGGAMTAYGRISAVRVG